MKGLGSRDKNLTASDQPPAHSTALKDIADLYDEDWGDFYPGCPQLEPLAELYREYEPQFGSVPAGNAGNFTRELPYDQATGKD